MTYDNYRLIFIVGAIACGIMVVVSIILFIALKIPNIIGDLSGRNAKKAIENIRKQNENSGGKGYRSSAVNLERGKVTDRITPSGKLQKRGNTSGFGMRTEKISTMKLEADAQNQQNVSNETTVLNQNVSNGTTVLEQNYANETTVLNQAGAGETTVLGQFMVLEDITFIHTNEFI